MWTYTPCSNRGGSACRLHFRQRLAVEEVDRFNARLAGGFDELDIAQTCLNLLPAGGRI